MHDLIRSITSVINSLVLIAGAYVAYQTFVVNADVDRSDRSLESFESAREVFKDGTFMMDYLFDEDVGKLSRLMTENNDFVDKLDQALAHYTWVATCIEINKCDKQLVDEILCAAILTDAQVVNRSFVAEIEAGGVSIDRYRLWKFYELVETCLSNLSDDDYLAIDHEKFLARFKHEIDVLNKVDRLMFIRIDKHRRDREKTND